jgi:hypothetical protein
MTTESGLNSGQEVGFLKPCFLVWLGNGSLRIGIDEEGVELVNL